MAWADAPDHYVVPVKKADQCGVPGTHSATPPPISIGRTRLRGTSRPKRSALAYQGQRDAGAVDPVAGPAA
jgi:hypothetical protein